MTIFLQGGFKSIILKPLCPVKVYFCRRNTVNFVTSLIRAYLLVSLRTMFTLNTSDCSVKDFFTFLLYLCQQCLTDLWYLSEQCSAYLKCLPSMYSLNLIPLSTMFSLLLMSVINRSLTFDICHQCLAYLSYLSSMLSLLLISLSLIFSLPLKSLPSMYNFFWYLSQQC